MPHHRRHTGMSLRHRFGHASAEPMNAAAFAALLESLVAPGRQMRVRVEKEMGFKKTESVYINFINLPPGIGGAGGGAEAENNRISFWVRGWDAVDAPADKVKIETSNTSLYKGESYTRENRVSLRAKSAAPKAVAEYLAKFLNDVIASVPPRYTHTGTLKV